MKIVQITPGTGNFHCGSCLRDLALTKALRRLGHDVVVVPLYLPFVGEESEAGDTDIFFGGINVFFQQVSNFWRRTPRWLDRQFDRPGFLRWAASRGDTMTRPEDHGALALSMIQGQEGNQRKDLDRLIDWIRGEELPDVVCLSNALLLGLGVSIKQQLQIPVVVTLQGEDSFLDALHSPWAECCWEALREAANSMDAFFPVSNYHGKLMRERLALPQSKVFTLYNGIDLDSFSPRVDLPNPPVVGYLARLCRIKGLSVLVDAFIQLKSEDRIPGLRLHVAGTETPANREFVNSQWERIRKAGLADDVSIRANLSREEKALFLQELSILSVPTTYGESFGLYLLEAMACGVPVVQPNHAAFPEIIERTGGGRLYSWQDSRALGDGIVEVVSNSTLNRQLGEAGLRAVRERFSIEYMAREFQDLLSSIVG